MKKTLSSRSIVLLFSALSFILFFSIVERFLNLQYLKGEIDLSKTRITQFTQPVSFLLANNKVHIDEIFKKAGIPNKKGLIFFWGKKMNYFAYMKADENYGLIFVYDNKNILKGMVEFPSLYGKILTPRGEFLEIDNNYVFYTDRESFYGDDGLGSSNKRQILGFKRRMNSINPCINFLTCPTDYEY